MTKPTKSISSKILGLAIPNIITNISVPLLSSVDTALMGQFSAAHLGAVGIGSMIFNFLYWNFGFLRMGTVGMTAQAYGAKNESEMIHTVGRALLLGVLIAVFLLIFRVPIRLGMAYLMQTPDGLRPLVQEYFNIRIWAAPATLALYGLFGFFFGMQNVFAPLILTIIINVVNILLSYLFILNYGMDVAGVAWGTVIAQYVGLVIGLIIFAYRYRFLFVSFRKKAMMDLAPLKNFFRVNRDIFIRTLCLSSTFFFFYSQSAEMGETVLAANVVLLQFLNWMSFGVDGFAYASEALVGRYKGARDQHLLQKTIQYSLYWGMGLAALYSLIYGIGGEFILHLFTKQPEVIAYAKPLLFWVIILPIIGTPSYIWDGVFIGLTATRSMRNTMILAFIGFLLVYVIGKESLGSHSLWFALMAFLGARGVGQWLLYRKMGVRLH